MKGLRLLNSGEWNKPPILTAARHILIGALAGQFDECTLGDAATFLNGTSYDPSQVSEFGKTPIIRISNITNPASAYLRTGERFNTKFYVQPGDLLVSWSASFKSVVWPGPEGLLNQHIFKVTERKGFERRFVRHAIEASFDEMQEHVVGIGMMHLRRSDFLGQRIPMPPFTIQRAAADYLDSIEAESDGERPALPESLEKQRRTVARIEELAAKIREARMLRAQSSDERKSLHLQMARDAFPEPCGHTVSDWIRFQTGYAFKSEWFADAGVRLARNANIGHGTLDWGDPVRLPAHRCPEFDQFLLEEGDILIALDRPIISTGVKIARVHKEDLPCLLLQRVARVQYRNRDVLPEFFFHWLRSPRFIDAIDPGRSNGVPHISHKDIEKIPFAVPSIPEQRRIVAELDTLQEQVDALKRLQAETAAELDALLPSVLSKAFAGEL